MPVKRKDLAKDEVMMIVMELRKDRLAHNGLAINRPNHDGAVFSKVKNHTRSRQREKRAWWVGYIALLCVGKKE